jgi:hypothetical protein
MCLRISNPKTPKRNKNTKPEQLQHINAEMSA